MLRANANLRVIDLRANIFTRTYGNKENVEFVDLVKSFPTTSLVQRVFGRKNRRRYSRERSEKMRVFVKNALSSQKIFFLQNKRYFFYPFEKLRSDIRAKVCASRFCALCG